MKNVKCSTPSVFTCNLSLKKIYFKMELSGVMPLYIHLHNPINNSIITAELELSSFTTMLLFDFYTVFGAIDSCLFNISIHVNSLCKLTRFFHCNYKCCCFFSHSTILSFSRSPSLFLSYVIKSCLNADLAIWPLRYFYIMNDFYSFSLLNFTCSFSSLYF
jgi:hypothetical protein